jgi:hypothetical protein
MFNALAVPVFTYAPHRPEVESGVGGTRSIGACRLFCEASAAAGSHKGSSLTRCCFSYR